MELEKQVVSLELAKQLKESGYPQEEGLWWWTLCYKGTILERFELFIETPYHLVAHTSEKLKGNDIVWGEQSSVYMYKNKMQEDDHCVAPTVAELGERLPRAITTAKTNSGWASYFHGSTKHQFKANTEANARAKAWLYLKKGGLL